MRNQVELKEIRDVTVGGVLYDTNLRHELCQQALIRGSTRSVAKEFGIGNSTIWRWLKVYGYAPLYFAHRDDEKIHYTGFDKKRQVVYSDTVRLSAALYAVRQGYGAAMSIYRCSPGSLYNWIKCFKLSNIANN